MERFTVTMYEEDIDYFERERADLGYSLGDKILSKSAFIRFLLEEHKNKTPQFIKNKNIISNIAELNTNLKKLMLKDKLSDEEKLYIHEKINQIENMIKKM